MKPRVKKAYKHITAFLLQPHIRDKFIDNNLGIALYNLPMSLLLFTSFDYYKADISSNRQILWVEEGHKYEDDK